MQTEPFSQRISKWRKKRDFRQKEAAAHFGVTLNAYQKWEKGDHEPNDLAMCEINRRMEIAE